MAPEGFTFPIGSQIWAPLAFDPAEPPSRTARYLTVVARLAPGRTLEEAQAQMTVVADRLAREHPKENRDRGARVYTLAQGTMDQGLGPILALWQAAAGFVLLIGDAAAADRRGARAHRRGPRGRRAGGPGQPRAGRALLPRPPRRRPRSARRAAGGVTARRRFSPGSPASAKTALRVRGETRKRNSRSRIQERSNRGQEARSLRIQEHAERSTHS